MSDISILMPVYNGGKYLKDSIGSLDTITSCTWELLIHDDGSTDNSAEIIKSYADKDSRIKVTYSKENQGAAIARNGLVERSQADVFFVLDCDNIIIESVFDRMYSMLQEGKDVVCPEVIQFFGYYEAYKLDNTWDFKKYLPKVTLQSMVTSFMVPACSGNYLYRRRVFEAVKGYHKEDICETWGFGWRHTVAGYDTWICPGTVYNHRFCHDGYYLRLPQEKMPELYWQKLNEIRDKFTAESVGILDKERDGSKIISSGVLRCR